jgi:(heptosyl)LPS beta-1,4-glucosyltransferase
MDISALIVAEGLCPDMHLSLSIVVELAKEIIVVDIGIDPEVKKRIKIDFPQVHFYWMDKPEYVELIRQESFKFTSHPWILLLDPDEYLSPDLVRYIQKLDEDLVIAHTHFKIPRQNYIFGQWISHSRWWPDYQIRLFQKDQIEWPKELHAQPILTGKGHIVPAFENEKLEMNARTIVHHNYTSVVQYIEKTIRYAKVEAHDLTVSNKDLTLMDAMRKATSEFISRFFAEKGYKDGMHGFALALLQMFYYIIVYLYVWEKRGYPETSVPSIIRGTEQLFLKTSKETLYWLNREKLAKGKDALINHIKSKLL